MVLHICRPETIQVIEEISQRTGKSAERVVETAVYEYRARLETPEEKARRWEHVQALADSLAARFEASGVPAIDHGDLLYDENGLPREGELSEVELRFYFPERYTSPEGSDDGQELSMALQIQTPAAVRLVKELSEITGESVDTAVEIAARERIERLRLSDEEAQRRARVYALVEHLQARFRENPWAAVHPDELLYGEDGLPK